MSRLTVRRLSVVAFGALVAATVAAFFVVQHLKVTTPVIGANITYPEAFSPGPHGCKQTTHTSFYLQHRADDVDVYVIDSSRTIVRTIVVGHHMRKGVRIPDGIFVWNGRDDNGRIAPDGTYYFRVGLRNQGRTIDLTGYPILLRTVAPHPVVTRVAPSLLPDGGTAAQIQYTGNEGHYATVRIYRTDLSTGKPPLLDSFVTQKSHPPASWGGRIGGRQAPPGTYLVGLDVTDRACNTGHFPQLLPPVPGSTAHAGVTVRYLAALPPLDAVAAGSKAAVLVDSRRQPYVWALRRVGAAKVLAKGAGAGFELRVPVSRARAGLYVVAIRSGIYRTEVPLVVHASKPPAGGVLVALPALTWQGLNQVDDDGDGIPDTLDGGGPIQLGRVLTGGLPSGFGDEAALLTYLDRSHLPYDMTTDIGLIDGVGPQLGRHSGLMLAGSERWLPTALSAALRSYVQRGGRVLSLGIDSLRRGVSLHGTQALSPTAPGASDVFSAHPGAVVNGNTAEVLVIRDDLRIFSGTSQALPGFKSYQPITPPVPPSGSLSLAGVTSTAPTVVGYGLGRGIVIELGLPGFGSSIAHSIDAQELTRALWTVLSH